MRATRSLSPPRPIPSSSIRLSLVVGVERFSSPLRHRTPDTAGRSWTCRRCIWWSPSIASPPTLPPPPHCQVDRPTRPPLPQEPSRCCDPADVLVWKRFQRRLRKPIFPCQRTGKYSGTALSYTVALGFQYAYTKSSTMVRCSTGKSSLNFTSTVTGEASLKNSKTFYVTAIYAKMLKMARGLIVHEVFVL